MPGKDEIWNINATVAPTAAVMMRIMLACADDDAATITAIVDAFEGRPGVVGHLVTEFAGLAVDLAETLYAGDTWRDQISLMLYNIEMEQ